MKVFINNQRYDFESDYDLMRPSNNGWSKQNQDAFKITKIGDTMVFVKRFDKSANKIVGCNFLRQVQNAKIPFLPMIYDLVSVQENGREVTYLFQETLNGNTFEEYITNGQKITLNPYRLMENLYHAFKSILKKGFWYTDFVPKNIFVGQDGNFYLIDLDSVAPLNILPNADCAELSNVDRRYKIAVSKYVYRDILKYNYATIRDNLTGDTINFLELFIFLGQCHYFLSKGYASNFLDPKTLNAVPQYLFDKNTNYTQAIFKSCFSCDNNTIHQQILNLNLINHYLKTTLFTDIESICMDFSNKQN